MADTLEKVRATRARIIGTIATILAQKEQIIGTIEATNAQKAESVATIEAFRAHVGAARLDKAAGLGVFRPHLDDLYMRGNVIADKLDASRYNLKRTLIQLEDSLQAMMEQLAIMDRLMADLTAAQPRLLFLERVRARYSSAAL
jgi:hypothetical protein